MNLKRKAAMENKNLHEIPTTPPKKKSHSSGGKTRQTTLACLKKRKILKLDLFLFNKSLQIC